MLHVTIKHHVLSFFLKNRHTFHQVNSNEQTNVTGIEREKKVKSLYSCVTLYFQGDMQDCRSAISVVSAHKLCR